MSEKIIKEKNTELNSISKSSLSIEDSIKVLEEKISKHSDPKAENYNGIAYEILLLQLNQLKKLKEQYDKFLEDDLLTRQTKDKLGELFGQLLETVKSGKQINNDLALIGSEIRKEKSLKDDTLLGKMNVSDAVDFEEMGKVGIKEFFKSHVEFKKFFDPTIRDYVEKHINFKGNFITGPIKNISETEFMTYFYDTFTVKYLDYIYTNKLELLHTNLNSKNGLYIDEKGFDELLGQTMNNMLERGIIPEAGIIKIKISLLGDLKAGSNNVGGDIERDILKISLEEIKKVTNHKVLIIKDNIDSLNLKSNHGDFKKSVNLVKKLDSYVKNIIPIDNRESAEILIDTIKKSLKEKTISILKEKHKDLDNTTKSLKSTESGETKRIVLGYGIEELDDIYDIVNDNIDIITKEEFDIESKKKAIKVNYEIKMQELEKMEFRESIGKDIDEIKKLIDSIKIDNIGDILRQINEKNIQLKKRLNKTHILGNDEKIPYDKEFKEIDEKMIDKLLYTYLNDLGKKVIADRADIRDTDLFFKLTNSLKSGSITEKLMKQIIEQGYYYAFVNELRGPNGERILERMKKNEQVWRNEFGNELDGIIDRIKAEDLFVMTFVESSVNPLAISEKGAKGYFQMLPGTADNHGMVSESDLRKPKKSAEMAASYLGELMKADIGKPEEIIIANALLRYNGWWSNRLNKEYTKDIKNTILELTNILFSCKSRLITGEIAEKEALELITKTHIQYFNLNRISKGLYHFSILDDRAKGIKLNRDYIIGWINDYTKDVLTQQYMYPEQFKAAKRAYEYHKNRR